MLARSDQYVIRKRIGAPAAIKNILRTRFLEGTVLATSSRPDLVLSHVKHAIDNRDIAQRTARQASYKQQSASHVRNCDVIDCQVVVNRAITRDLQPESISCKGTG